MCFPSAVCATRACVVFVCDGGPAASEQTRIFLDEIAQNGSASSRPAKCTQNRTEEWRDVDRESHHPWHPYTSVHDD